MPFVNLSQLHSSSYLSVLTASICVAGTCALGCKGSFLSIGKTADVSFLWLWSPSGRVENDTVETEAEQRLL